MGWGGEGVGCRRGDNARGSTSFTFNKKPPPNALHTHTLTQTHTPQLPPSSRKGRSWGWRGSMELEEGGKKERKSTPPPAPPPPSTPFQCSWDASMSCTPFFSHRERRKTLHRPRLPSLRFNAWIWLWHQTHLVWLTVIYYRPHLLRCIASCFGTDGCQSLYCTWIVSLPSCIEGWFHFITTWPVALAIIHLMINFVPTCWDLGTCATFHVCSVLDFLPDEVRSWF